MRSDHIVPPKQTASATGSIYEALAAQAAKLWEGDLSRSSEKLIVVLGDVALSARPPLTRKMWLNAPKVGFEDVYHMNIEFGLALVRLLIEEPSPHDVM